MKNILLTITFLFVLLISSYGQSYQVIVNQSNTISSINKSELSAIFFKKKTKFSNGQKAVPVEQKGNSSIRKNFSTEVLGKSVTAVKSFWQQSVFQGKATPPVEKASDDAVISYVAKNQGAIGYVSAGADVSTVKSITIN